MFQKITPIIKIILIINVTLFILTWFLEIQGIDLAKVLSLYFMKSDFFMPHQFVTYMFMHANFWHIFFNMFNMVMFGVVLEQVWGGKKFLIFYFLCGFAAVALHLIITYFQYLSINAQIDPIAFQTVFNEGAEILETNKNYIDPLLGQLNILINSPMLGASGAVFGILIAFGLMFPNTEMFLFFIPIPIKAKYMIGFMVVAELFLGVANFSFDNVAHFAHLGGAICGLFLTLKWKRKSTPIFFR